MTTQGREDIRELFEIKEENSRIILAKADDVLKIAKSISNQVFHPAPHIMWTVEDYYHPPLSYVFKGGPIQKTENTLAPSIEEGNYAVNIIYSSMEKKEIKVKVLIKPLAGCYFDVVFGATTHRLNLIEIYNKEQLDLLTEPIGKNIYDHIVRMAHDLFYKDDEWVKMTTY